MVDVTTAEEEYLKWDDESSDEEVDLRSPKRRKF